MSLKSTAVMLGAMYLMRRVDQEDPAVLMQVRLGFSAYMMFTLFMYSVLHFRITRRRDSTKLTVTEPKPAFAPPGVGEGDGDGAESTEPKSYVTTVMEYDLKVLSSARKQWLMNAIIISLVHYKMETVSPLVMSALMGFMRLVGDDPLVKLHIFGMPAVDSLQRPFKPEQNPLLGLAKDFLPKLEPEGEQGSGAGARREQAEDLHDDGESEDDDEEPTAMADRSDEHVKSDFDDEDDAPEETGEDKKTK